MDGASGFGGLQWGLVGTGVAVHEPGGALANPNTGIQHQTLHALQRPVAADL